MADGAGLIMKIKNRRFEVLKCLGRIKRNDTKVAKFFNEQKFGSLKASITFNYENYIICKEHRKSANE